MWMVGLIGLASLLFLLQRLRVRYRQQTVITTLFWKEALEEARARVLVRRFRHLLAYLLVLIICALMWLGFADPDSTNESGREHIVLLDASAAMRQEFSTTVALLEDHLQALPDEHRRVILCGGSARTLLAAGESDLLLAARLEGMTPQACPSNVEQTLRDLLRGIDQERETSITIAGTAPVSATTMEALPESVTLQRLSAPGDVKTRPVITALGVGRAASGDWDRIDVLCEVREATDSPQLEVTLDGRPATIKGQHEQKGPGWVRIVFSDVPAQGQALRVTMRDSAGSAISDPAGIRLPTRERIRVQVLDPDLLPSIEAALRADAAVEITSSDPDVVIAGASPVDPSQSSLRFVPTGSQPDAVTLHRRAGSTDSERDVLELFSQLGISEVDAMDAAQATGRAIAIGSEISAGARSVSMWSELLSPRFNFVQSRSFPLFLARSIRWLAAVTQDPAFVAAGEPAPAVSTPRSDDAGRLLDPVGAPFVPPVAGAFSHPNQPSMIAAMFPAPGSNSEAAIPAVKPHDAGTSITWGLAVSLLVLLLLLVEWFLTATGRIP